MSSYRVTAPLVVARQKGGTNVHVYAGSPVPDSVSKEEVDRLLEGGFIEAVGEASAESDGDKAPAKSASKEEWVAYAESQGDDEAADKTKEQLIADHREK